MRLLTFNLLHILLGNYHLIEVERFACLHESEGCVVWSLVLLAGSPKANRPQVRCLIKNSSRGPHEDSR